MFTLAINPAGRLPRLRNKRGFFDVPQTLNSLPESPINQRRIYYIRKMAYINGNT